jgi:hypothetical protein
MTLYTARTEKVDIEKEEDSNGVPYYTVFFV